MYYGKIARKKRHKFRLRVRHISKLEYYLQFMENWCIIFCHFKSYFWNKSMSYLIRFPFCATSLTRDWTENWQSWSSLIFILTRNPLYSGALQRLDIFFCTDLEKYNVMTWPMKNLHEMWLSITFLCL